MPPNTYANWRVPEQLAGAAAAAARLSHNRPLPKPGWPNGDWDAFSSGPAAGEPQTAFGLRVGMKFQAKKAGYEPTGFGGPLQKGAILTVQNIVCDADDGCILHWEERGGCTILDEPSSPDFRGKIRQFMGSLKYIPAASDANGLDVGDRVEVKKTGAVGWVQFVGTVFFEPGVWVGVDLESAAGKNNGSVTKNGRTAIYFKSRRPASGLFVRPDAVAKLPPADVRGAAADDDAVSTATERRERRAALLAAVRANARQEAQGLGIGGLSQRAQEVGVAAQSLREAQDDEVDPKGALVALLVQQAEDTLLHQQQEQEQKRRVTAVAAAATASAVGAGAGSRHQIGSHGASGANSSGDSTPGQLAAGKDGTGSSSQDSQPPTSSSELFGRTIRLNTAAFYGQGSAVVDLLRDATLVQHLASAPLAPPEAAGTGIGNAQEDAESQGDYLSIYSLSLKTQVCVVCEDIRHDGVLP